MIVFDIQVFVFVRACVFEVRVLLFFKLDFFRTQEHPEVIYGDQRLSSHYQGQALKLSKHFRPV